MSVVPSLKDLSFYAIRGSNEERFRRLVSSFQRSFGADPSFISRSPGRVNLIGDHVDYNHLPVLPMALDVDVIAAVGVRDDAKACLVNSDPKFKPATVDLPEDGSIVPIDPTSFEWSNYFRCSLIVAHKFIAESYPELVDGGKKPLKGMNLVFDGNVPTGAGLSSSAAFCVVSTLAILRANGIAEVNKADLARITIVSEHYVGLNNGGMDQTASIYGEFSKVLFISFKPKLECFTFPVPDSKADGLVFLINNSLVESNKIVTGPVNYNLRVVEMAVSSEILTKAFKLTPTQDSNLGTSTYRNVLDEYFPRVLGEKAWDGIDVDTGCDRLTRFIEKLDSVFTEEEKVGFTTEQAAARLDLTVEQFTEKFLKKFPVRYETLKLYQRTKHVYTETLRVMRCLKSLRDSGDDTNQFLKKFGDLLNEAQVSNNIDLNSSTPELEEICQIAAANGAYGSRITGAGFGGSVVHLTTVQKVPAITDALIEQYYKKHFPEITKEKLKDVIIASKPSTGSCIVEVDNFLN